MKKTIYTALCGILVLAAGTSCEKKGLESAPRTVHSYTVSADPIGRPSLNEGIKVHWKNGDKISMVSRNNEASAFNAENCFIDVFSTTDSGEKATFTGSYGSNQQDKVYAVHPFSNLAASSSSNIYVSYRAVEGTDGNRNTLFYVPGSPLQQAVAGDFPTDYTDFHKSAWNSTKPALWMGYAVLNKTDEDFHMHNACALLKFHFTADDITSAEFNFGTQNIAGYRSQIGFDEGNDNAWLNTVPWSGQGQTATVRVYPPSGHDTFVPGETYYAVIACVKTEAAPTVTLRKATKVATFTGTTNVTLAAGEILPLGSKGLDDYVDAWTNISSELTLTMDFTQGAAKPFNTSIPTASTAPAKSYTLTQDGTDYKVSIEGSGCSFNYDATNNYLVLKGVSKGCWICTPAIPGRRLKTVTCNAAGYGKTESTTMKFTYASNSGTSSTYGTVTLPLESAGAAVKTMTSARFPANTRVMVGAPASSTVNLRSLTLIYE